MVTELLTMVLLTAKRNFSQNSWMSKKCVRRAELLPAFYDTKKNESDFYRFVGSG